MIVFAGNNCDCIGQCLNSQGQEGREQGIPKQKKVNRGFMAVYRACIPVSSFEAMFVCLKDLHRMLKLV